MVPSLEWADLEWAELERIASMLERIRPVFDRPPLVGRWVPDPLHEGRLMCVWARQVPAEDQPGWGQPDPVDPRSRPR